MLRQLNKGADMQDVTAKHPVKVCPLCNQPIDKEFMNDLTSLKLRNKHLIILYKLIEAGRKKQPTFLSHRDFGMSRLSFDVYLSHIRSVLRKSNSPWRIVNVWGEGYFAEKDLD